MFIFKWVYIMVFPITKTLFLKYVMHKSMFLCLVISNCSILINLLKEQAIQCLKGKKCKWQDGLGLEAPLMLGTFALGMDDNTLQIVGDCQVPRSSPHLVTALLSVFCLPPALQMWTHAHQWCEHTFAALGTWGTGRVKGLFSLCGDWCNARLIQCEELKCKNRVS